MTNVYDSDRALRGVMPIDRRKLVMLLVVSLVLIFGGALLANSIQTAGGTVDLRDVRFMGSGGIQMSGLLYIPENASAETPAPGVLAVHGYINSRETQDGFAIELARRGFVVLALDQTGHGFSDPPAFANGFGGPDGLAYLRSLDFVDPDNIGMEGHSMGGWAIQIAAAVFPDGYEAMVIEGSSPGTFGAPEGTPTEPRNVAVVFSLYDEFSQLMWGSEVAGDVAATEKMQNLFGTDGPVEVGRIYGDGDAGTARVLHTPPVVHPGDHISPAAIGQAVDWLQMHLEGANEIDPADQIWQWKAFGNLLTLIGLVLFIFPAGGLLLLTDTFAPLRDPLPEARPVRGAMWWVSAALLIAIPILTFFWLQNQAGEWIPVSRLFPQQITTGIMVWAVGNGLISLVLFLVWHLTSNRESGGVTYGLSWPRGVDLGKIGRSLLLAATVTFAAYILLSIVFWLWAVDARIWVVALKPMSPLHFQIFLSYLIPFLLFFLMLGVVLHGQMRQTTAAGEPVGLARAMVVNMVLLVSGFIILLLVQYIPLLSGNPLPIAEPLLTIVAYQFVALLAIVALVSTYFYHKTGHVYVGAFLNAIFVTWYIVAGQAIHYAF